MRAYLIFEYGISGCHGWQHELVCFTFRRLGAVLCLERVGSGESNPRLRHGGCSNRKAAGLLCCKMISRCCMGKHLTVPTQASTPRAKHEQGKVPYLRRIIPSRNIQELQSIDQESCGHLLHRDVLHVQIARQDGLRVVRVVVQVGLLDQRAQRELLSVVQCGNDLQTWGENTAGKQMGAEGVRLSCCERREGISAGSTRRLLHVHHR